MDMFMQESQQLKVTSTEWTQLKAAATRGELRMEPGTAEAAAGHCNDMIAKLTVHIREAHFLVMQAGFGDCLIGNQLMKKFNDKATGPTNSIVSLLQQHQDVLRQMADTYLEAGRAFRAQEQANASGLKGSL